MCADLTLDPIEVVRLYGLRFKIAPTFKRAVQLIGSFLYGFWMMDMKPLRRCNGNKHLYRESLQYREAVKRKIHGCHVFIRAGITAEGLLQHLAVSFPPARLERFPLPAAHHRPRHRTLRCASS
jgi:hypothetical protein